jgi:predicted O-linked N-acetylglucosamine transferase (SPINDLY family)
VGVPVVTLVGYTAVSQGRSSILSNIGLPELASTSTENQVRLPFD